MNDTVCILGSGPTKDTQPAGLPTAGVSSGYVLGCDMLITVDKARWFDDYDGTAYAHVPKHNYFPGWNPTEEGPRGDMDLLCIMMRKKVEWVTGWADWPAVVPWESNYDDMPDFLDLRKPIGMWSVSNSMLFAVQIAPRLGFRHLVFAGCDMHELVYCRARSRLEQMHEMAVDAGYDWSVTSKDSSLSTFLPLYENTGVAV